MTLKQTIEYYKLDGKVFIDENAPDDSIILDVSVEFEAYPTWENDGIGSYEYWGSKEYDSGVNYVSLESNGYPTWDETLHTPDENEAIRLFTKSPEFENLCDRFCKEYEKNSGF